MITGYEIIGKNRIKDKNRDCILFKSQNLYINTLDLTRYNYVTFLRKIDATRGECIYLCFSKGNLTDKSFKFRKTMYGYYIVSITDIIKDLFIKDNCYCDLKYEDNEDGNLIVRLDINY